MVAAEEKAQVAPSSGSGAVMAGEAAPGTTTAKGSTKGTRDRITGLLCFTWVGACVVDQVSHCSHSCCWIRDARIHGARDEGLGDDMESRLVVGFHRDQA